MTLSTVLENSVGNLIDSYGNIVTIVTQTATTGPDELYQTPNRWVNSATSQAHCFIYPGRTTRGWMPFGVEQVQVPAGLMQEADYRAWFEATWTLEESQSGTVTLTHTRYKVNFNSNDYEIVLNKPWQVQDNVIMKFVLLKKITT